MNARVYQPVIVNVAPAVPPFSVAQKAPYVSVWTGLVFTVNVADVLPAGTMTVLGTVRSGETLVN